MVPGLRPIDYADCPARAAGWAIGERGSVSGAPGEPSRPCREDTPVARARIGRSHLRAWLRSGGLVRRVQPLLYMRGFWFTIGAVVLFVGLSWLVLQLIGVHTTLLPSIGLSIMLTVILTLALRGARRRKE